MAVAWLLLAAAHHALIVAPIVSTKAVRSTTMARAKIASHVDKAKFARIVAEGALVAV
jgi:hypothetical protein